MATDSKQLGDDKKVHSTPDAPVLDDAPDAPLVAVAGPTGSGKSELALAIAEEFNGEIVNCDSLQVFRHFDIGTAKLPAAERRTIRHHLMDVVNPDELFTAGEYARLAREALAGITARHRLPVVAGGTGFYLRALLDGLFEGPTRDQKLRDRLAAREARRPGSLHRILTRLDSDAARKIHANDVPKVMRALEVCLLVRRPVSELFRQGRDGLRGYRVLKLGLLPDRDALYERLDLRSAGMFEHGLVEEVRHILALGFAAGSKPFESHGYRQAMQFLQGELSLREAVFYAQRNTRQYAKRQITWFRREAGLVWLKGFGDAPEVRRAAIERVGGFLAETGPFA
ncbi:MAG TPA: tRNA (adenosine(37)-N6)-dimethylallyltransferase MiaA [Bryobacteraceae bacterium]|nr:tRNA (adenosine(37)-N6)-dimethylallyltransferase MiaA [Bryobacteraceae bacterium]